MTMESPTKVVSVVAALSASLGVVLWSVRLSIPLLVEIDNIWVSIGYGAIILGCMFMYCFAAAIVWDTVMGISNDEDTEDEL